MTPSLAEFACLLDDVSVLLVEIGSVELASRFADEAQQARDASSIADIRRLQRNVRQHFIGTTGSFNDVMSLNINGALTPALIDRYNERRRELRRYARKILW